MSRVSTAQKRHLRAATTDDAPKTTSDPKPKTLVQAAQDGDYRELLVAQRMDIARSLQNPETQGPARAALHRQLGLIAREIRELDEARDEEGADNGPTPDEAFDASAV